MANLWASLRKESRYSLQQYFQDAFFTYQSNRYPLGLGSTMADPNKEGIESSFVGLVRSAYKGNGVVFACILSRLLVFSEARFQWQQMRGGRPGDLFGNTDLALLERPWPNGTTGELEARAEQDSSLGGNFYVVRERTRLRRLRPDWVSIVLTVPPSEAVESDVAGIMYQPGGPGSKAQPVSYVPGQFAHWSPIPDPEAQYRGMSWLSPVIREIEADSAATKHKLKFFQNAATPQIAVSMNETVTLEQFKKFMAASDEAHMGVDNAYKTLYLGGGADVTVIGKDLRQLDFKNTQGAGETRIAAAAGVPPVIVGLSEGLQAATYSNYAQARRRFADGTLRPLWRSLAAALESIFPPPAGTRLWYDDRDIPFLREDAKDSASIESTKAATIRTLVDGGFTAASAVAAVLAEDLSQLDHTGLTSVQLNPPGTKALPPGDADDSDDES